MVLLRLKNYTTYLEDGRSSVSYKVENKGEVLVAVIAGVEPKEITEEDQLFNIDEWILRTAEHILKVREARAKKEKKAKKPKKHNPNKKKHEGLTKPHLPHAKE